MPRKNDYILEKFIHNGKEYYRDKYGFFLDTNANIVGCFIFKNNKYKYYFDNGFTLRMSQ